MVPSFILFYLPFLHLLLFSTLCDSIPLASSFRAFGPLPYTSPYLGLSPLSSLSSHRTLVSTVLSLRTFPSESARGGFSSWRDCPTPTSDTITCPFSDADPTTPFDFVAISNFSIPSTYSPFQLLQCSDPALIVPSNSSLSPIHCPSDPYNDSHSLCPLALPSGEYTVAIFSSAYSNTSSFSCVYHLPPDHPPTYLLPLDTPVSPSIVRASNSPTQLAGPHLSLPLLNAHPISWATAGAAVMKHAPDGMRLAPQSLSEEHYPLPRIAPGQVRYLRVDLMLTPEFVLPADDDVHITLSVEYEVGEDERSQVEFEIALEVVTWRNSSSYHFTYIDVDGSVQAAAVLPPAHECENSPMGWKECSVLLSTHGAGVDAVGRAWTESYRTQKYSWVVLPTGRRKFGLNWEGPQMMSAITAVKMLARDLPGVPETEKEKWRLAKDTWVMAGHSMGGHGALLLSTHFPDMLLAALPAMGWLRLSTYGGGGFKEQLSYSDATLRAMFVVSSAEFGADLYAENLLGVPFLARVGTEDDNVPPSNLRKFVRLLKENEIMANRTKSMVRLSEVPGEGHWFDGVVDDDVLQKFLDRHLVADVKPELPKVFSMVTINPASSGSRGGLRILSLEVPFEMSRITVERDAGEAGVWVIRTENVRRIRYQPVHGIVQRPEKLYIDDTEMPLSINAEELEENNKFVDLCALAITKRRTMDSRGIIWQRCRNIDSWGTEQTKERGPDTSGPAAQVLTQRRLIVVFPEGDKELLDRAVDYVNSLSIRGIAAMVTTDSDVSVGQLETVDDANMVLLGGPDVNRMAKLHFKNGHKPDVHVDDGAICVSTRCYTKPGTGMAFLSPGPKRTLLFYVAGTDRDGLLAALPFLPRSPASQIPEWVVVSKQKGWGVKGFGGILGVGYWDWNWNLEVRKSYPAEMVFDLKRSGVTCATEESGMTLYRIGAGLFTLSLIALIVVLVALVRRRRDQISYKQVPQDKNFTIEDEKLQQGGIEQASLLPDGSTS